MEYVIWGAQALLFLGFGAVGIVQVAKPDVVADKIGLSHTATRVLGAGLLGAAAAVLIPQALGVSPLMTVGAAAALTVGCFWAALRLTRQRWPRHASAMLLAMVLTVFVAVFRMPV